MRIQEFQIDERQKLKEMYPHLTEEQLDEILPAIGAAAGMAGRVAAKGAMAAGRVGATSDLALENCGLSEKIDSSIQSRI